MKILSIILKIIETGLTCIWGVFFGIFFPVAILLTGSEIVPKDIAESYVIVLWLIVSVIGYVIPAALILCKRHKTAAVMSVLGFIGTLTVYGGFASLYAAVEDSVGPTELYLPCIFITILDIIIAAVEERNNIKKLLEQRNDKKEEIAPSILGDDRKDG